MKMKSFVAIAIAAALIVFIGLQLTHLSDKNDTAFRIEGQWQIDSAYELNPGIGTALMQSVVGKKNRIRFMKDSTVAVLIDGDTASAKYYLKDSTLFLNTGEGFKPNKILERNNNTLRYFSSDSMMMVLTRKD